MECDPGHKGNTLPSEEHYPQFQFFIPATWRQQSGQGRAPGHCPMGKQQQLAPNTPGSCNGSALEGTLIWEEHRDQANGAALSAHFNASPLIWDKRCLRTAGNMHREQPGTRSTTAEPMHGCKAQHWSTWAPASPRKLGWLGLMIKEIVTTAADLCKASQLMEGTTSLAVAGWHCWHP